MKNNDPAKNQPLVSIILPTLNTMPFIEERWRSIKKQTHTRWELIIADSFSDDGTWEYLSELAHHDDRISIFQIPPGLYSAWNFCLDRTRGEYVYIATSDDSMKDNCIAKMVEALEAHPECDVCDSVLQVVDDMGNEIDEDDDKYVAHFWHCDFPRAKRHIRFCPHDYYLHFGGKTVYTSVTQLLIRRALFDKTGQFPTEMGSSGDFYWGMQTALHANVIFLPEKLASWRIHDQQATASSNIENINRNFALMTKMAENSLAELEDMSIKKKALKIFPLMKFKALLLPAKRNNNKIRFMMCAIKTSLFYPIYTIEFILNVFIALRHTPRFFLIYAYDLMIRSKVEHLDIQHLIQPIPSDDTDN